MAEFIPFDFSLHKSLLVDLNEEYFTWMDSEMQQRYDIDIFELLKLEETFENSKQERKAKIRRYSNMTVEYWKSIKPPLGIYYLLQVRDKMTGMGAFFRKSESDLGWVKRMYVKPTNRGKGYGKAMLQQLIKKAKQFGCSTIQLETAKFMETAQHVYREAGFQFRDEYPDTEVPPPQRALWLFMEKTL